MARHDEPDPATWWERYGHRLHGEPTRSGERETTVVDDGSVRTAHPQRQGGEWFSDAGPAVGAEPAGRGPTHLRAFDPDSLVRARGPVPDRGWRRILHAASLGRIDPGPSAAQLAAQDRLARVRSHLAGTHRVAVTSLKGGVGKTTVTACLGLALAEHRGDRILALDANPDAGTLADRLTGHSDRTVRDLLDDLAAVDSWTAVSRYTSLAGRLQVLASEQDPAAGEAFTRDEYLRIDAALARYFSVMLTDSGTGMVHSAMAGTLDVADSLVVVGAPTVDGAGRASKTLDWLVAHGHGRLVADAVVVLVGRAAREIDAPALREHFAGRCRAVVEVPHDPHLATGGRIDPGRLRPATREAFLELAASVAEAFPAHVRR
ncbi:MinD/ParA family protein [Pseudonocardia kujensis]|uniref:MinD/ParA family ATP-binding protein n=1 Tax=Pseudonocardia kujensis TaxID=1128675 RepID=UPI001E54ABD6|nr:MinD/ParA family protein [Pseudonocardia kujensis]MCE0763930.1 MinD/ParA family protein [Pseudonocardia kujensis]